MKYFFVNLLLKVFYKLPIWFLNIFFRKSHYIRDNYLDQQANVFLKLIGIFGYKPNINDFNHKERLQTNFARISLSLTKKPQSTFSFKDLNIGQSSELIAREYTPNSIKSQKVMLYFHGGGYALGSIDTHHDFVSLLANKLGIKIYSLEYSLSPENKYSNRCTTRPKIAEYSTIVKKRLFVFTVKEIRYKNQKITIAALIIENL